MSIKTTGMQQEPLTVQQLEEELKRFFTSRQKANARYSTRQMADKLGISTSTLQKVLRGERKLGFRLAKEIGEHLGMPITKQPRPPRSKSSKKWKLKSLDAESSTQVSWVNIAILEMMKLEDFQADEKWVAHRLGLTAASVRQVLDEMENARMLARTSDGWVDLLADATNAANAPMTSEAIRAVQASILTVSRTKIRTIPYESREHAFTVFPVATADLAKLKKKIIELSWDIADSCQKTNKPKDQIYCFQLGFFPLTQN